MPRRLSPKSVARRRYIYVCFVCFLVWSFLPFQAGAVSGPLRRAFVCSTRILLVIAPYLHAPATIWHRRTVFGRFQHAAQLPLCPPITRRCDSSKPPNRAALSSPFPTQPSPPSPNSDPRSPTSSNLPLADANQLAILLRTRWVCMSAEPKPGCNLM